MKTLHTFLSKSGIAILMTLLGATAISAQTSVGLISGFTNYSGDLQQVHFETATTHFAFGLNVAHQVTPNISLSTSLIKGKLSGSDALYETLLIEERNLSFESDIYELGVQGEWAIASFGEQSKKISNCYLFAGLSAFHINPKAQYNNEWYELQPLGTEGQHSSFYPERTAYSLWQVAIPMGIGFKVHISDKLSIQFEAGLRKTFTDYIDDVSQSYPDQELVALHSEMAANLSYRSKMQGEEGIKSSPNGIMRGNPNDKDMYYTGLVKINFNINKDNL